MIYVVVRISTGMVEYVGRFMHHAACGLKPGRTFGVGDTRENAEWQAESRRLRHLAEGYRESQQ